LKPIDPADREELRQAVACAFENMKNSSGQAS